MDRVSRGDEPAIVPLDDKEKEGPVSPCHKPGQLFEMADGPLRNRIGKECSLSLPIGDTFDFDKPAPAGFVGKEVIDAAPTGSCDLGAIKTPPAAESGYRFDSQKVCPEGVDPDPHPGKRLRLLGPEAV